MNLQVTREMEDLKELMENNKWTEKAAKMKEMQK
jgi:hypothetical protein